MARSPSSAIAIINEVRAKGPFTQTVLGVTMVTDVAVIILFAATSSVASAVLHNLSFDIVFLGLLIGELALALVLGYAVGRLLAWILSWHLPRELKGGAMLLTGLGVFMFVHWLQEWSHATLHTEIFVEPLLVCLVASFYVTNYTVVRTEFLRALSDLAPAIYIIFFTLVGASLALDVLVALWPIALAVFAARVAGIFVSSFAGGALAGDPMTHNQVSWMTYLTQAGVGLGLAKELAVEFPGWGDGAAAMIISVIVLSQLIGPPFFKWAINHVGEAHSRAPIPDYEGARSAIIFGLEGQSAALARLLVNAGWTVRIGSRLVENNAGLRGLAVEVQSFDTVSERCMQRLGAENADTIISMLNDEENYTICELAYERFGTEHVIVRLQDHQNFARFEELGAIVIEPSTAIVSLMAHFVWAPTATSMLMGERGDQDVADIPMRNRVLDGLTLREIRLPMDALVLSVQRDGNALVSHGYTRLAVGDVVTVLGSRESLNQVAFQFAA